MTRDYLKTANGYINDVFSGKQPACKWVKAACQRQYDDLQHGKEWDYLWNPAKAKRICAFAEQLPHIKGEWANKGEKFQLEPWQVFILSGVFGWERARDKKRRFRTVYIEVPRKNGKSTISSTVGLYMLALDGEQGAEVYSVATSRDQAKIVFNDAQQMARRSPEFRAKFGIEVNAHNINIIAKASKFEALSAEHSSLEGLNTHCGIVDELHAHKTRLVHDVIENSMGARSQPLLWLITTAGSNQAGICYEQRNYLTKILERITTDDTYFGVIYSLDDADDWTTESFWRKANPNYGVSVMPDDMQRLAQKAMQMPSAQNNFLTKRLNVWVNADTAWMDMRHWAQCANPDLDIADFAGEPCIIGIDLASKRDLASMAILFFRDGRHYLFCRHYCPENTIEESTNSQYSGWEKQGYLTTTPGNVIDFGYIEDDLRQLKSQHEIKEIPFDPFQATQFSTRMIAEGFPMVEYGATVRNFSEPMKQFEALVLEKKIIHNGDPVLSWAISNVVCHVDKKDNIYPNKERPENKIDPVVASLMALGRLMANESSLLSSRERLFVI